MKKILLWQSASLIIGTIVGAGILGLPFAFAQAGFYTGLAVLLVVGACVTFLALFLGEISLRTKENHQLTGYLEIYLGRNAKHIQAILMLFGMYSALLAYTIGQGEILANLFGGSTIVWSLVAYIILAYLVTKGLSIIKKAEFIIAIIIFSLLFILIILASPQLLTEHLTDFNWQSIFIPYGAILFACTGLASIAEAKEVLGNEHRRLLKPAILIGHLVPIALYILFCFIAIGVTGSATTEVATVGLASKIGLVALAIGSLFSVIAMSSSFMTLGTAIKEVYQYDYGWKEKTALVATLIVPIIFFLAGFRNFFGVVSMAGAISVGLTGLFVLATFWRARFRGQRKPEYAIPTWLALPITIVIALVFIGGLIYTLY